MPANDTVSNPLYQGIAGAGAGIGQAIQNYIQYKQKDAAATGQIEAYIKQVGQGGVQALSPDGQKLTQKMLQGSATFAQKLQLLGELQATGQVTAQNQQLAQGAQQLQASTLENQKRQMVMRYLSGIMGNGQQGQPAQPAPQAPGPSGPPPGAGQYLNSPQTGPGGPQGGQPMPAQPQAPAAVPSAAALAQYGAPLANGGTGSPGPTPPSQMIVQPPKPVTVADPQIQALYPQILRTTLGDTDKAADLMQKSADAINQRNQQNYDQLTQKTVPSGNLYFKQITYDKGMPQTDEYIPEMIKGPGTAAQSTTEGQNVVSVPHGQKPPGKLVQRGTDEASSPPASPYNTNDPAWQSDVQSAYEQSAGSQGRLSNAKLLLDTAQAYAQTGTSGMNALLGNPAYAKIKQFFTGTNPQAAFQTALSANTGQILSQIKAGTGSTGGRILQTEYENTAKLLGEPNMPMPALLAAAQNNYQMADRQNNIDNAYATYRAQMPAGDAEALAVKQFGTPPVLTPPPMGTPPVSAPQGAPANPALAILAKYGISTP